MKYSAPLPFDWREVYVFGCQSGKNRDQNPYIIDNQFEFNYNMWEYGRLAGLDTMTYGNYKLEKNK